MKFFSTIAIIVNPKTVKQSRQSPTPEFSQLTFERKSLAKSSSFTWKSLKSYPKFHRTSCNFSFKKNMTCFVRFDHQQKHDVYRLQSPNPTEATSPQHLPGPPRVLDPDLCQYFSPLTPSISISGGTWIFSRCYWCDTVDASNQKSGKFTHQWRW